MSTIASPRASVASFQTPTSSRRTSIDTVTRSQASSPSRVPPPQQRRNRAALRDYYGIKSSAAPVDTSAGVQHEESVEGKDSELDREGFNAEGYVAGVLGREGLEGILRVEGGMINEIKGLDGERKALVYDNYSKLITATDTIRKMRTNMDPLIPTTSMLAPAITHIAETATALSTSLQGRTGNLPSGQLGQQAKNDIAKQRDTVRWVLQTPRRMQVLLETGQKEQAAKEWEEASQLLDKWEGVAGVEELRDECTKVLDEGNGVGVRTPQTEERPSNGT